MGRGGRGPDPGAVGRRRGGELGADGGDGLGGAGVEVEGRRRVVPEAFDGVRGRGSRLRDGAVAGVAGWDGGRLGGGSAGVDGGDSGRRVVDCSVDARGVGIVVGVVGDEADIGCRC